MTDDASSSPSATPTNSATPTDTAPSAESSASTQPQTPSQSQPTLSKGQFVRIVQQIPQRDEVWTTTVEGEVVKTEQKKTGSWYAHSKDDKLWLDRVTLRKADGELIMINLDPYSHVEILDSPAA